MAGAGTAQGVLPQWQASAVVPNAARAKAAAKADSIRVDNPENIVEVLMRCSFTRELSNERITSVEDGEVPAATWKISDRIYHTKSANPT